MISLKIIKIEIIVNAWLANINTNQTKIAITKILFKFYLNFETFK
mgnify:CR=1 FL=1